MALKPPTALLRSIASINKYDESELLNIKKYQPKLDYLEPFFKKKPYNK
jgi:hypothetical protein